MFGSCTVTVLTSVQRGPVPVGLVSPVLRTLTGVRMFGRDDLVTALRDRGLVNLGQRVTGLGQFVSAGRPVRARR